MAISRVTQGRAESSSATISGVSPGQRVLVFAFRRATSTVPSIPSDWTNHGSAQSNGPDQDCSVRVGSRIVPAGGLTTTGTWTNAERIFWVALASDDAEKAVTVGNVTLLGSTAEALFYRYGALTLTVGKSGQWLIGGATRTILDTAATAPSGMSTILELPFDAGTDSLIVSTEGVRSTDWPQTDADAGSLNLSANYASAVVEVYEEASTPPDAPTLTMEGGAGWAQWTINGFTPHADDPTDTHQSTTYQLSSTEDFASLVVDDEVSGDELLAYRKEGLSAGTYYGRAFVSGESFTSAASNVVEVTITAGVTPGTTPSLSLVAKGTDFIEVEISAYDHPDGEVEPSAFDPEDPHPFLATSTIQLRLTADGNWNSPDQTFDVAYTEDVESRRVRFTGLTQNVSYTLRGKQLDGYLAVDTAYSSDLVVTTDATPVVAPDKPTLTLVACGRDVVLSAGTFGHPSGGTHAASEWRICASPYCRSIVTTDLAKLTSFTWFDVGGGLLTFAVRYKDNSGAWGAFSDSVSCDAPPYPPQVVFTNPPHGEVIASNVSVEWEADDPFSVGWHYDVELARDGITFAEIFTDTEDAFYVFAIAGRPNGAYVIRVRTRNPTTGETGEWGYMPVFIDRTGVQAIHYHFADLNDFPDTWRQVGAGPEHVSFGLKDETDPADQSVYRVGLIATNVHGGLTTRRSGLVFDELGQPDEFDMTVTFEQIPDDCDWYPYRFANAFVTRGGALAFGVPAGNSFHGIMLDVGIRPWYLGQEMACVSASFHQLAIVESAKWAAEHPGTAYRYGRNGALSRIRTVTDRVFSAIPSHASAFLPSSTDRTGGAYVYTDEDGVLGRNRQLYTLRVQVRRGTSGSSSGWVIKTQLLGAGIEAEQWHHTQFVQEVTPFFNDRISCGSCGIYFEDMDRVGVGRSVGILYTDFSLRVVSYGSCEPPDTIAGCQADWDLTFFDDDDVTPRYGTADNEGNVGEADFYDNLTCVRPYLKIPKNFSATDIDYPAGASTIGGITVGVVDKRLIADDQDSGIVTVFLDEAVGRRTVLRRWREDLGMVTVFDGVVESYKVEDTGPNLVTVWFSLLDPRERERNVELFQRNETMALWPESGPILSYGLLPNDLGYLLSPAQPEFAMTFHANDPSRGVYSGYVVLAVIDELNYIENAVEPWGSMTYDAATQYYRAYDITVRWRLAAGGNWVYLRDMPANPIPHPDAVSNAILRPVGSPTGSTFSWRLYMGTLNPSELPDDEDLIDVQILAARTSDTTPFFWDLGSYGDGLLAAYRGDWTRVPPRIRYNLEALEAWALETGNGRFIARKTYPNLREFVEHNFYAVNGAAPSFDADMKIAPSRWELPPADQEIVELDIDWIIPDGGFSHSVDSVINRVKFTVIRESVVERDSTGIGGRLLKYMIERDRLLDTYLGAAWTRLVEEPVVRDYPHGPSIAVFGEKPIEYEPITVRELGTYGTGATVTSLLGTNEASLLADRIAGNVLSRYAYGAAKYEGRVVAGMPNHPQFDPKTLDLAVGDWVIATVPWLPEYSLGKRNLRRYMQIESLKDEDIGHRHLVLVDGGPARLRTYDEYGGDGYGGGGGAGTPVEEVLSKPTVGSLLGLPDTLTGGSRVEVPVTFPSDAPLGYQAAVFYAVSASEPATTSGSWLFAGFVASTGNNAYTPVLPAGSVVWIRARGEAVAYRPSAWTTAKSITLTPIPGLLEHYITIDEAGEPTLHFLKNPYAQGLLIEYSIGSIGHTPSYTTFEQVDADEVEWVLEGLVVEEDEEIYVQSTAYPEYESGTVGGPAGNVYVAQEDERGVE